MVRHPGVVEEGEMGWREGEEMRIEAGEMWRRSLVLFRGFGNREERE